MRLERISAIGLTLLGVACLHAAFAPSVAAVDCDDSESYIPAYCIPAHEQPRTNASMNLICQFNANNICAPAANSGCGMDLDWGLAVAGTCETEPISSTPRECQDNFATTIVTLHRWKTHCLVQNGVCSCQPFIDPDGGSENVEVCDCFDQMFAQ